jgi:HEPN domain-containing protein
MDDTNTERKQETAVDVRSSHFDIRETNETQDMWLFDIARNHYVAARVCVINGMNATGVLLAHQSIEAYLKAIAHSTNNKKQVYYFANKDDPRQSDKIRIWGHDLPVLLRQVANHNPILLELVSDSDMEHFLERLTAAYDALRYAKADHSVKVNVVCEWLDRAVSSLDHAYHESLGFTDQALLFVPTPFKENFTRGNTHFPPNRVTDHFVANVFSVANLSAKLPPMEVLMEKAKREAEASASKTTSSKDQTKSNSQPDQTGR